MTSPLPALDAERVFYFIATLDGNQKQFDRAECFRDEDLKLNFKVKNANGEEVDLSGADIEFNLSPHGFSNLLLQKTVGSGVTVSGADVSVSFNSGDSSLGDYSCLKAQLKITKTSKMVVASFGFIDVKVLIA